MKNKTKKLSTNYDTIIIGAGAGGLTAAICLARAGQKVLVLEKHDVPGGWCHSFYLDGHRFSPGVHYIGLLGEGESTATLYEGLGIANDLTFFRMNPKGYEHCWIGDERIDIPANFEALKKSLAVRFPEEKKGINDYIDMVRMISEQVQLIPKLRTFWDHVMVPFRTKYVGKYAFFSLKRVIDWYLKDPLLKSILNIQYGDHGLPPKQVSFTFHCMVMNHYASGGYYPMGGGGALVKAMTNAVKRYGSQVKTSQGVRRILLEGTKKKRAIGVELENGTQLFAKRIISNADPGKTFLGLIGEENLSKKLVKRLAKTKYSCTSLMLFLVVDMDVRQAGLDSGNIWLMPNKDQDEIHQEMFQQDIAKGDSFAALFLSCTTIKDPVSFDGRHHVLEAVTFINHESFAAFKGESSQRSPDYLAFKDRLIEKFITTIEKVLPTIRDKIVRKELGTPITNEHYINTTNGCVYGTEKSFWQVGPFAYRPQTEIENLYLCGASTLSHGVAGANHSGVATAAKILNCRPEDLIQPDASQKLQVYEAEDNTDYPAWMQQKINTRQRRLANQLKN